MRTFIVLASLAFVSTPSLAQDGVQLSKDAIVKCADAGVAECQYRLARMTEVGDQVQQNLAAAKQLYELSYRNGYAPAGEAILRLAKNGPPPTSAPAPASAAGQSAALSRGESIATTPKSPTVGQLTFFPDGSPAGVGPIYLGQSERDFVRVVPKAECTRSEDGYQTCQGSAGLSSAASDFFSVFDKSKAAAVFAMVPSDCPTMVRELSSRYPKASPLVTKLMAANILKQIAKDLPPSLELTAWTQKGAWSAFTMCDPSDGSGMVVLATGRVAQP